MNDTKLIQSIKNNDGEAIEKLMAMYSGLLWKVADGILCQIGSASDTEEVVADVFIHLWRSPDSFDERRSNLKNYLCLLCRSKAIDKFRQLSRNASLSLDSTAISEFLDLESNVIQNDELNAVRMAVESLPAEDQSIFIRRFIYGQKPGAIAKATGLNIRKVENTIYRSKIKIRDFINQRG